MRELTQEEKSYVIFRTLAKRRAAPSKAFHYKVAKNLFLVNDRETCGLTENSDFTKKQWLKDVEGNLVETLDELKKIAEFQAAINASEALKNKKLKELLEMPAVQYVLLKAEEAVLSPQEAEKINQYMNQRQQLRKKSDLNKFGDENRPGPAPDLTLTAYRKYEFKQGVDKDSNQPVVFVTATLGSKKQTIESKDLLSAFTHQYRTIQKKASVVTRFFSLFRRDALDKASDSRPWYQRYFSKAPEKTDAEKMAFLLKHAKHDFKSNTAKALITVLDTKIDAIEAKERLRENKKDITDVDDLMKELGANVMPDKWKKPVAVSVVSAGKPGSPAPSVVRSSISGDAIPAAAAAAAASSSEEVSSPLSPKSAPVRERSVSQSFDNTSFGSFSAPRSRTNSVDSDRRSVEAKLNSSLGFPPAQTPRTPTPDDRRQLAVDLDKALKLFFELVMNPPFNCIVENEHYIKVTDSLFDTGNVTIEINEKRIDGLRKLVGEHHAKDFEKDLNWIEAVSGLLTKYVKLRGNLLHNSPDEKTVAKEIKEFKAAMSIQLAVVGENVVAEVFEGIKKAQNEYWKASSTPSTPSSAISSRS